MDTYKAPTIGTTYSGRHARSLGLDPDQALLHCLRLPLQVIRLGAYWDAIEQRPGEFDFTALESQLLACQEAQKEVILCVGVKAPRWPEYYFPAHVHPDCTNTLTQDSLLRFIEATIRATRAFSCICTWQVENEPLDPSGPERMSIPLELLCREIELVRSMDSRKIVVTLWGNDLLQRGLLQKIIPFVDSIGIDLYYSQYVGRLLYKNLYVGPRDTSRTLQKALASFGKPIWISELQAEPWEENDVAYRGDSPKSMSVEQLQANWHQAVPIGAQYVLFWGVEYWLWQQSQGNPSYIQWITGIDSLAT